MYKQLNEELRRLQQQLKDLQDSPTHVTVTRHETVSTPAPPDKVCTLFRDHLLVAVADFTVHSLTFLSI